MKVEQVPAIFQGTELAFVSREHCSGDIAAEARKARAAHFMSTETL
jgi:hypothetical protein